LRGQKLGNITSKHINANVCKNDCTCACNRLSFYLLYVNGNAKNGSFVVKWYAAREAEKWWYAVRKATIGRYAVRKGGGGCHPHEWSYNKFHLSLILCSSRNVIEDLKLNDVTRRLKTIEDGQKVAIPIKCSASSMSNILDEIKLKIKMLQPSDDADIEILRVELPWSKKLLVKSPQKEIAARLKKIAGEQGEVCLW